MSTYFRIDPAAMPWPPVFEKVFTRRQFTILKDGTCLAEAVVDADELQALEAAGAEIIGDSEAARKWIENHPALVPVVEEP